MTIALLLSLALLALVDSTSFGTLGIPIYLLLALKDRAVLRMMAYLGTVAVFYFGVGVALMLGLRGVFDQFGELLAGRTGYWVSAIAGVAMFAASFWFDSKRRKPKPPREPKVGGSLLSMVGLGITAAVIEVATMLPYLAAVGMLTNAGVGPVTWLPVLAGYVVVMILPALLLLVVRALAWTWLKPKLERVHAWILRNKTEAIGWALGIVGFLLARDGIVNLFFK
ncbi:GAP family protein [Allokutzneria multivorans]|uniref:GAP family protein n=1 Tax=Allokutzneria multivorans TaxID=1142134 RepID=A0ABP7QTL5_9PSEU